MKLRWYDRILVALGGLVLVALGALAVLSASGLIDRIIPGAAGLDTWLGDGWKWSPLVILIGVLLIVWGLWLFIRPFSRGREPGGKYYTLQNEPEGNVRISVHAIDRLVYRCIETYGQVVSAKVRIGGSEDAMRITLHMTVRSDVRIPTLVEELRADIKRSLEHSAGVTVETVEVYVDATRDDKNAKDEIKYIPAPSAQPAAAPVEDPINTTSFYTAPVVVTGDRKPEPPITADEPTVQALKQEVDLGPNEPLPVDLSAQAFPFPEAEAGVPLEIYTEDLPIEEDAPEKEETEDA